MNKVIEKFMEDYKKEFIENDGLNTLIEHIDTSMNKLMESLKPLMDSIKESAKILAQHSVDLGFYPSNKFSLYKTEFINLKNKDEEITYLCKKIKELLTDEYIKELNRYFNKPKIIEIYDDYCNEKYDDAILKMITLKLESTSSEEIKEIERKFNNIVTGVELPKNNNKKNNIEYDKIKKLHQEEGFEKYAYYIFAPYYYSDKDNSNNNTLFCNYRKCNDSVRKEKYKVIPYNRNAIMHGYINFEEFGNEENCLRWFSVLINTYELFKLLEELNVSE